MLVHLALLSASVLLGPPPAHRVEISLAPSYAQAAQGRSQPALSYQRLRLQAGLAYTVDAQHTAYLAVPLTLAWHESELGISYRNGDLGDAVFGLRRWLDTHWHVGMQFSLPLSEDVDELTYGESKGSLPALDTGRTGIRLLGGWVRRSDTMALALSAGADVGLDEVTFAPVTQLSCLWFLVENALEAGFFADGKWGLQEGDERWLRVGLLERVGPATGLSSEVSVSTIFAARNVEAATEASLRLVWRR